jgi:peptidoglycan/xylan/chitin deacetylase (PgdA/CDA1 family)
MARHIVCLTWDFDTQSGLIQRGMTTPTPLSRGEFGLIGTQRILAMTKERGLKTTFFIPGFTIESHPAACEAVVEAGHEVGAHSWAHIPPADQSRDEEEADMVRSSEQIEKIWGRKPAGYRSPSWDLSESTIELLEKHGHIYDSSLMGADYIPYRARVGDIAELGKPFVYGKESSLVEMPISWSLDDHPHFEYMRTPQFTMPGLRPAREVMDSWYDEWRYFRKTVDWGILTYTMHPYVIGRGFRMYALEQLVDKLIAEGAVFMSMEEAALEARAKLFPDL